MRNVGNHLLANLFRMPPLFQGSLIILHEMIQFRGKKHEVRVYGSDSKTLIAITLFNIRKSLIDFFDCAVLGNDHLKQNEA